MVRTRAGSCQSSLDIAEGLGDLLPKHLREMPVVIPPALARGLDSIGDPYGLRVVKQLQLALSVTGVTKNSGLFMTSPVAPILSQERQSHFRLSTTRFKR
jgi:hypothetical protein